jgi:SAM-dependent methyltransferase
MHILDAGSGYGQNTYFLSNACPKWSILAVDVKSNQISGCNHFFQHAGKQNVTFKWRDLTELHMENTFDLILSVETLTYIEQDEKVMHNFFDALKPDGMLLLWFPVCNQSEKIDDAYMHPDAPHRVRNGYNVNKLKSTLQQIGFTKMQSYEVYGTNGLLSRKLYALVPTKMLHFSKATALLLPFYYLFTLPICLVLNMIDYNAQVKKGAYAVLKAWK